MGRPKKYASAAERQAAFRARNFTVEFRVSPENLAAIDKRAADVDMPRAEWLLRAVRWVLTNTGPGHALHSGRLEFGRDYRGEAQRRALDALDLDSPDALDEFFRNPLQR